MNARYNKFSVYFVAWLFLAAGVGLLIGAPVLYPDTKSYYRVGDEIGKFIHLPVRQPEPIPVAAPQFPKVLSDKPGGVNAALQQESLPAQSGSNLAASIAPNPAQTVLPAPLDQAAAPGGHALSNGDNDDRSAALGAAARSPYYALFLVALTALGGGWLCALVQTAIALVAIWLFARRYAIAAPIMAVAPLLLTSFFAFCLLLMPDIFAGIGILCAIVILTSVRFSSRVEFAFHALCITLAASFHSTNGLVVLGLVFAALLGRLANARWAFNPRGAVTAGAAALIGMVALVGYPALVHKVRHIDIYQPPFITARFFADGPERAYLAKVCPGAPDRFAMCQLRDAHFTDNNDFLWHATSAYRRSSYDLKLRIIREDKALFVATLMHDPIGIASAAIRNTVRLLPRSGVAEILGGQDEVYRRADMALLNVFDPGKARCWLDADACSLARFSHGVDLVITAVLAIALLAGLAVLVRGKVPGDIGQLVWLAFVALLGNAALCGSFSGPSERYQSRIIWIIVLVAIAIVQSSRSRGRSASES